MSSGPPTTYRGGTSSTSSSGPVGFGRHRGDGVYSLCDGPGLSHGPYLGTVTLCSCASIILLSVKACIFSPIQHMVEYEAVPSLMNEKSWGMPVLFLSSQGFVDAYWTHVLSSRLALVRGWTEPQRHHQASEDVCISWLFLFHWSAGSIYWILSFYTLLQVLCFCKVKKSDRQNCYSRNFIYAGKQNILLLPVIE